MGNGWEGREETSFCRELPRVGRKDQPLTAERGTCTEAAAQRGEKLQTEQWDKPVSIPWSLVGSREAEGIPEFWKKTCSAASTPLILPKSIHALYLQHLGYVLRESEHKALRIQNLPKVGVPLIPTLWSAQRGFK